MHVQISCRHKSSFIQGVIKQDKKKTGTMKQKEIKIKKKTKNKQDILNLRLRISVDSTNNQTLMSNCQSEALKETAGLL